MRNPREEYKIQKEENRSLGNVSKGQVSTGRGLGRAGLTGEEREVASEQKGQEELRPCYQKVSWNSVGWSLKRGRCNWQLGATHGFWQHS